MNMFKAYEKRDQLNEKMILLLIQHLREQRINYINAIENYPPDRMEKYGTPHLNLIEQRIREVEQIISEKFPNA